MSNYIRLRKGLNIPILGEAETWINNSIITDIIAVKPTDFRSIIPKLLVKEGDNVKAGSPIFTDKYRPEILFTSPISGVIEAIVRGEKRKLLEIRIQNDHKNESLQYQTLDPIKASRDTIIKLILKSGLWPAFKQRPYGTIPNTTDIPRDIFISGFNSAPLAPDLSFILREDFEYIQVAINALNKLTTGKVHVSLKSDEAPVTLLKNIENVDLHIFEGKHPAGNVGVQIHHIAPINKGETIWTIEFPLLAILGKIIFKGVYDMKKTVAITGPRAVNPSYVKIPFGASISTIDEYIDRTRGNIRIISGNVLSGEQISENGFIGFYDNQITILEEGDKYELFGWANPIRHKKYSISRSYFSWLFPKKRYDIDTNLNGGERAFVMNGLYDKVLPMDILPVFLLKAILAEDIDKMEELGIYEVIEEDFALCEYICPSKTEVQSIIAKGIDTMLKEMS